MTTMDLPSFGLFEGRRAQTAVQGRWTLMAGGTVETRLRVRPRRLWFRRTQTVLLPLVSGALIIGDPVHMTVGEVAIAVDKTHSVRLTVAEVTALGNQRYSVEFIVSALGEDAGPDQGAVLEGYADRDRDGVLRAVLSGPAPAGLGGEDTRIRLTAAFRR
jgi:hypothetical protein